MGRPFKSAAVVIAYDASGNQVDEDIVPAETYSEIGSRLLNSAETRVALGIRFISFRLFDEAGVRVEIQSLSYDLQGNQVAGLYRMPDGSIIENPYI